MKEPDASDIITSRSAETTQFRKEEKTMNLEHVFMKYVGESIVSIRKEMGIAQNKFAEAMQVTVQTQAAYETGKREPTLAYLARMSTYTGRSIASILGEPLRFVNYADIIECIRVLDDIGVLKVRAMQLDGQEGFYFDETVTQYLRAMDALKTDSDDPAGAAVRLQDLFREKAAPLPGSGFDPSGAAQCQFAEVNARTVLFGYIQDNPVIVREMEIDGKPHYNVLTPGEKGSWQFMPVLNIPVRKMDAKVLEEILPGKLHEAYDHIPAKDFEFTLAACQSWEVYLPCIGNRTMVVSAFDRAAAPMTILLTTLVHPSVEGFNHFAFVDEDGNKTKIRGEHEFVYHYLKRLYSPCQSEEKAKRLVWKHGRTAPSILGGPEENFRMCKHCYEGDGGFGYAEWEALEAAEKKSDMKDILW